MELNDPDSKTRWSKLKSISGIDPKSEDKELVIKTEAGLTNDPVILADHFNKFFVEKVKKLKERTSANKEEALKYTKLYVKDHGICLDPGNDFSFRCVEWDEVWRSIMALNNSNSTGVDGIPSTVLKKCINCLVNPIRHVANLVLMTSTYPDMWKEGIIRPLFKAGDRTLASNYRPLSPVLNEKSGRETDL